MIWIIRQISIITLVLGVLISACCWLGSHGENPSASILKLENEQFAKSCWHQIWPGKTSFTEARAILQSEPDRVSVTHPISLCWTDSVLPQAIICVSQLNLSKDDILDTIQIRALPFGKDFPVTLGDLVAFLNVPPVSNICLSRWNVQQNRVITGTITTFNYGEVLVESYSSSKRLDQRVDPQEALRYIEFRNAQLSGLGSDFVWIWHGFVSVPIGRISCK